RENEEYSPYRTAYNRSHDSPHTSLGAGTGQDRSWRSTKDGAVHTLPALQLLRQDRIPLRGRVQRDQQLQPAAQIPARHLTRTSLHVDIAARAVQVQRERILERLPRIFAEQLRLLADIRLPPQQGLLQMPAFLVDLAVDFGA